MIPNKHQTGVGRSVLVIVRMSVIVAVVMVMAVLVSMVMVMAVLVSMVMVMPVLMVVPGLRLLEISVHPGTYRLQNEPRVFPGNGRKSFGPEHRMFEGHLADRFLDPV